MNKINPAVENYPFVTEDFQFINDSIAEAFKGILGALALSNADANGNPKPLILFGCNLTKGTTEYIVTEGLISMGGEVFFVPAQTLTKGSGDTVYFVVSKTYQSNSGDESITNTYMIRRAVMAVSNVGVDYYAAADDMISYKAFMLQTVRPVWTNVTSLFTFAEIGGFTGSIYLGFDGLNYYFRGNIETNPGGDLTNGIMATFNGVGTGIYTLELLNTFKGYGFVTAMRNDENLICQDEIMISFHSNLSLKLGKPSSTNTPMTSFGRNSFHFCEQLTFN